MVSGNVKEVQLKDKIYSAAFINNAVELDNSIRATKSYVKSRFPNAENSAESIEYYTNLVLDSEFDLLCQNRNAFMISVDGTIPGQLNQTAFYEYIRQDNPDAYDIRLISLVGRLKDNDGKTIYDYLEGYCTNEKDKQSCVTVLKKIKEAMDKDADNGHPVLPETMTKFNECYNKIPAPKEAIELYDTNKDTREKMQDDAKVISLVSGLQMAIIENNYNDFNKALDQIQEYVDKESGITDEAQKMEEFTRIAMSARADISGNGRNVFMLSLDNNYSSTLKFKGSVFYKFMQNYNPESERDTRILSLLGRSVDGEGKTFYDHLLKMNPREMKNDSPYKEVYKTILLNIKKAMDKDEENGHPIPKEVKKYYNICAAEVGISILDSDLIYKKEYDEQIKAIQKEHKIRWPDYLIPPYEKSTRGYETNQPRRSSYKISDKKYDNIFEYLGDIRKRLTK